MSLKQVVTDTMMSKTPIKLYRMCYKVAPYVNICFSRFILHRPESLSLAHMYVGYLLYRNMYFIAYMYIEKLIISVFFFLQNVMDYILSIFMYFKYFLSQWFKNW